MHRRQGNARYIYIYIIVTPGMKLTLIIDQTTPVIYIYIIYIVTPGMKLTLIIDKTTPVIYIYILYSNTWRETDVNHRQDNARYT